MRGEGKGEMREKGWWPLLIVALLLVGWLGVKEKISDDRKLITTKEKTLRELDTLCHEYVSLKDRESLLSQALEKKGRDFHLRNYIEDKASKAGVKGHLKSFHSEGVSGVSELGETKAHIQLEGITLSQLVKFIRYVDAQDELVRVTKVSISSNRSRAGYLDADVGLWSVGRGK